MLVFSIPQAAAAPIGDADEPPIWMVALTPASTIGRPEPPKTIALPKAAALDLTMERIAACESQNDPNARNPGSTAKGRFQFLDGTWRRYAKEYWGSAWQSHSVLSAHDSTALAYYVARTYGLQDWAASRGCWAR